MTLAEDFNARVNAAGGIGIPPVLRHYLVPQPNDYTCAAAVLATVSRLLEVDEDKTVDDWARVLKLDEDGAEHRLVRRTAQQKLPCLDDGNIDYDGRDFAMAYIVHPRTGDDHVVLFLATRGDKVAFYDPFDDRIYQSKLSTLKRTNDPDDPDASWIALYEKSRFFEKIDFFKYANNPPINETSTKADVKPHQNSLGR